jgi:hypothetical protein
VRYLLLWRQWFRRREHTSSSAIPRSAATTAAAHTADAASSRKPRLATDPPRNSGSWTTPNGLRGSAKTPKGRVYRSRSATPGLDRLATTRRVVGDVGAIVAVLASIAILTFGVLWLWGAL